jgi:hypothetical protein
MNLSVILVVASPAPAAFPRATGQIAFYSDRVDHSHGSGH